MATYSRLLLSGSPAHGRVIPIVATAPGGTLIHTAVDGDNAFDEVYLWAANTNNAAVLLTVEWGGTGNPSDHLCDAYSLPANSAVMLVASGQVLNGALEVRAYASAASKINVSGYVNRIQ